MSHYSDAEKGSHPEPSFQPLFWTLQAVYLARAYYVAAELGVADLLKDGPKGIGDIARTVGADEKSLYRILRALASFGVFAGNDRREFEMTDRARALLSEGKESLRDWILLTGSDACWQAFGRTLDAVKTGRNGFDLAFGEGGDLYTYGDDHPDFADIFIRAQHGWTAWQRDAIMAAYDFGRFPLVVDVAGGRGSLTAAILKASPGTRAILVDQPSTVRRTAALMEEEGVSERCELAGGNIFDGVPSGGDLYIIKHVLRDWDDESVLRVLRNCHRAMPSHGTLLVIDSSVDPRNSRDRVVKLLDLEQMLWCKGSLRTGEEWESLLQRSGFLLHGAYPTEVVDAVIFEAAKPA